MTFEVPYALAEDRDLLRALGGNDELAFIELRRRHHAAVMGVALRLVHDRSAARQAAEDVFVSLWQAPSRFDPDRGSLRTFLLVQSRRRCVDLVRSEVARRRREDVVGRREFREAHLHEPVDHQMIVRLHQALDALGDDEAAAIRLAYFEGHTYVEVARLLQQPEGTIKTKIRSAMASLRTQLADFDPTC